MDNLRTATEHYRGHAFFEQLPQGKSSGQLQLNQTHLSFSCPSHCVDLPLDSLQIKMGGANNRLVFFSHPLHPEWSIYTADRTVLQSPLLADNDDLVQQVNTARGVRILGWSGFALGLFLVVILPLLLVLNMDSLTATVVKAVPLEVEQKLGESAWSQVAAQSNIVNQSEVTDALDRLVAPLIGAVQDERYQFKLHIVESAELNAFALPGGYMGINSGLILSAENAEEVLGVLAHEISHVTEQHGVRNVLSTAGTVVIVQALLGDFTGVIGLFVDAGPVLLGLGYSREFETEADNLGFDLLVRAGIDPAGLPQFFRRMQQIEQRKLEGIEDQQTKELNELANQFLSTHPQTTERIAALELRLAKLKQSFSHSNLALIELQNALRKQLP